MSSLAKTSNTLSENIRAKSVGLLNAALPTAIDLQGQIKQAHWTVRGRGFIGVHKLLDEVNDQALEWIDEIAERCAALGGTAAGGARHAAKASKLKEYPLGLADVLSHIDAVSEALSVFGKQVREAIDSADDEGDADTADLFTEVSREVDQALWMIEAQREPEPEGK